MAGRARAWCLTHNNYTEAEFELYKTLPGVKYIVLGKEVGESGTPHIQGYIYFTSALTLSALKKRMERHGITSNPHWTKADGNARQNLEYCSKQDEDPYIKGTMPKQGVRSDLIGMKRKVCEGATELELFEHDFPTMVKFGRGIKRFKFVKDAERAKKFRKVRVIFHTGPTGCGKSLRALYTPGPIYEYQASTYKITFGDKIWFDGYEGERRLVIDEYINNIPSEQLLSFLQGHVCRLPVKNGHTWALWEEVYITSNLRLGELHPRAKPATRDAIMNRITEVIDDWPPDS